MVQILALFLDFEGAKNILIWRFGGGWRFLTRVWHLYFDLERVTGLYKPIFQILALYLDLEGAKNIHGLILGFGGCSRFLTGVWHLDLDLDMVMNLAWISPEVLITLRSVEAQIQSI